VPRRDLEDVARPDLELGSVAHLDSYSTSEGDPEVMELARVRSRNRLDVHRPSPPRLVADAADNPVIELDDIDPAVGNRPDVIRVCESASLEVCHFPTRLVC